MPARPPKFIAPTRDQLRGEIAIEPKPLKDYILRLGIVKSQHDTYLKLARDAKNRIVYQLGGVKNLTQKNSIILHYLFIPTLMRYVMHTSNYMKLLDNPDIDSPGKKLQVDNWNRFENVLHKLHNQLIFQLNTLLPSASQHLHGHVFLDDMFSDLTPKQVEDLGFSEIIDVNPGQ